MGIVAIQNDGSIESWGFEISMQLYIQAQLQLAGPKGQWWHSTFKSSRFLFFFFLFNLKLRDSIT